MTTPIVLVPGFMLDETLWDEVVAAFPPERPVIRASLQGQATMEEVVTRIGDAAPPRFVIVGFSMGGYVARDVVQRFPDRCAGLILIATSLRLDTPAQLASKQAALGALAGGDYRGVSRQSIRRSLHPAHASDGDLVERIHAMSVRLGRETFASQLVLDRAPANTPPGCPTLIIAGSEDPLRSLGEAGEMQRAIPGSQIEIVEDTGHMIPLEQPEALARCMTAWLAAEGL